MCLGSIKQAILGEFNVAVKNYFFDFLEGFFKIFEFFESFGFFRNFFKVRKFVLFLGFYIVIRLSLCLKFAWAFREGFVPFRKLK